MEEKQTNQSKDVNDRRVFSFLIKHYRQHLAWWTILFLLTEVLLWNNRDWSYRTTPLTLYIFILVIYIALSTSRAEKDFWKKFSDDHGYSYEENKVTETPEGISLYCRFGRNRSKTEKVKGTTDGKPLLFSTFLTTIERESSDEEIMSFTMCEATLAGNVPSLIVVSKENTGDIVFLKRAIPDHKELTLEGDFNKYFSVYVTPKKEMEALEILTPDIMVELIKYAKLFSFEFNKNRIFVYAAKDLMKRSELEKMRKMLLYLLEKLSRVFFASVGKFPYN